MTAVFASWRYDGDQAYADLTRMGGALARFGPDSHDEWDGGSVAVGRRLKAVLPEDRNLTEIYERGRRYAVAADVHLTERDDLIQQLGLGDAAMEMSDAAVVGEAIERWDEAAFDRIYGSFAIIAWDVSEKRFLLARDHLGLKPLYYRLSDEGLLVASMPAGIHAIPGVEMAPDIEQYQRVLRDVPMAPGGTVFVGINRVMPGRYVVVANKKAESVRYWTPDLTPLELPSHADYTARMGALLDQAVAANLRGAGHLIAAHLSAGFDSSTVVAVAAEQLAATSTRIVAYTAVPKPGDFGHLMVQHLPDEGDISAETAAMYPNVEHVRVYPDRGTLENLDRNASMYPAPVRNLCNLTWNDAINDLARNRGINILLQGSMGNISISDAGIQALPELLAAGKFKAWFRVARGLVRNDWMRWRGVVWNSVSQYAPLPVWRMIQGATGRPPSETRRFSLLRSERYDVVTETVRQEQSPDNPYEQIDLDEWERGTTSNLNSRLSVLSADIGGFWKAQLGEWGIDCRDPTADRRLLEFSFRIPIEHLIWDGEPRALLRTVMAGRLPKSVLDNRKRGLQSADWHDALARSADEVAHEVERMAMYDPLAELIDLDRIAELGRSMPPIGSEEWRAQDVELNYRLTLLRSISVGSHMRRTARSNY